MPPGDPTTGSRHAVAGPFDVPAVVLLRCYGLEQASHLALQIRTRALSLLPPVMRRSSQGLLVAKAVLLRSPAPSRSAQQWSVRRSTGHCRVSTVYPLTVVASPSQESGSDTRGKTSPPLRPSVSGRPRMQGQVRAGPHRETGRACSSWPAVHVPVATSAIAMLTGPLPWRSSSLSVVSRETGPAGEPLRHATSIGLLATTGSRRFTLNFGPLSGQRRRACPPVRLQPEGDRTTRDRIHGKDWL